MNRVSCLLLATLLAGCSLKPTGDIERAASELRNSDITWDGTYFGLEARVSGEPARYLAAHPDASRPHLLAALEDPERFAAAHVLLSLAAGIPSLTSSTTQFNGLVVSLGPNGVEIRPEQRRELQAFWHAR
jgi:hypothetical protein